MLKGGVVVSRTQSCHKWMYDLDKTKAPLWACFFFCKIRELSWTSYKGSSSCSLRGIFASKCQPRVQGQGLGADWGIPLCLTLENIQARQSPSPQTARLCLCQGHQSSLCKPAQAHNILNFPSFWSRHRISLTSRKGVWLGGPGWSY